VPFLSHFGALEGTDELTHPKRQLSHEIIKNNIQTTPICA